MRRTASGAAAFPVTLGVVDSAGGRMSESEMMQRISAQVAMRKLGEPADVATLVAFLVSDYARAITGEILNVNCGNVLCG